MMKTLFTDSAIIDFDTIKAFQLSLQPFYNVFKYYHGYSGRNQIFHLFDVLDYFFGEEFEHPHLELISHSKYILVHCLSS